MKRKLADKVSEYARKMGQSRAEFIRLACEEYINQIRERELEKQYEEGYQKHPEDVQVTEALTKVSAETLPKEEW